MTGNHVFVSDIIGFTSLNVLFPCILSVHSITVFVDRLDNMENPFPRTMGNRSVHAMSLQLHLHDQMQSNSDLCDVVLVVDQVVNFSYFFHFDRK